MSEYPYGLLKVQLLGWQLRRRFCFSQTATMSTQSYFSYLSRNDGCERWRIRSLKPKIAYPKTLVSCKTQRCQLPKPKRMSKDPIFEATPYPNIKWKQRQTSNPNLLGTKFEQQPKKCGNSLLSSGPSAPSPHLLPEIHDPSQ